MFAHSNIVFDMSVPEMLLPLTSGGTMVVAPPRTARDPEYFAEWLRANPVDAGWATQGNPNPAPVDQLLPVPPGTVGELCLSGIGVAEDMSATRN